MGKDLKGRELGKGFRQKRNGSYEARTIINGKGINLCNTNLQTLKREFNNLKKTLFNNVVSKNSETNDELTLDEWFDIWFNDYKIHTIKKTSINNINQKYKKFGNILGKRKLSSIKNYELQKVVSDLIDNGRTSKYVKDIVSTITSIFEMAQNNNLIQVNPASMLYVPVIDKVKEYRILELDEEKAFLEVAKNRWSYELLYIMLNTGLRCGEIGALTLNDVDFTNKVIVINKQLTCQYYNGVKTLEITTPKTTTSRREIPFISDKVESVLKQQANKISLRKKELGERWRGKNEFADLLFVTNMGSPMTRYNIEREVNIIIEEMNLCEKQQAFFENRKPCLYKNCHPHALRHTFCSKCFKAGVEPKVVQQVMGHRSYSTTIDIYTHIMNDDIKAEINKFNQKELNKISNL
ncbi:site-specific integrase [uncultured Thomasclavelia sp.]|uniref:tyrosine-type recombinase/integrase n=1 Tax=uncultured Thomasclavelia sp. TaxID=3025759 RepID=UPI00280A7400|nr:site-specific integrase [uncultured Thomasclavelia sp.]